MKSDKKKNWNRQIAISMGKFMNIFMNLLWVLSRIMAPEEIVPKIQ